MCLNLRVRSILNFQFIPNCCIFYSNLTTVDLELILIRIFIDNGIDIFLLISNIFLQTSQRICLCKIAELRIIGNLNGNR